MSTRDLRVLALSGGVGGARMARALASVLSPGALAVAVNVADDFVHLGLCVSPDLDTVMYTLGDVVNPDTGWGRKGESWAFMKALARLGGETWFNLGDRDLAVHVERTRLLAAGAPLSAITARFCRSLGIASEILPVTDNRIATMVATPEGELAFQDYFVRRRCEPKVLGFRFVGAAEARLHPRILALLDDPALEAIVIGPSNPFVSIGPMLAIPGLREALIRSPAPVIAVSPIIGGEVVKGPAAKMMRERGIDPSPLAIAAEYGALLDGLVIDEADRAEAARASRPPVGPSVRVAQTLMSGENEGRRLAQDVLAFAAELSR
ncbi:MAG: 2-phospho-L-lactate transferase [Acetobacteraceae bacterium]